jgi:hypothetical protein
LQHCNGTIEKSYSSSWSTSKIRSCWTDKRTVRREICWRKEKNADVVGLEEGNYLLKNDKNKQMFHNIGDGFNAIEGG